jgi:hypothetical protein
MTRIILLIFYFFPLLLCIVALRPHELREGLNTLKKSVSPSLVRKNSTDTKLTDAEKDEILSNIEEIKNDAETTKSLIKEGMKCYFIFFLSVHFFQGKSQVRLTKF